MDNGASSYLRFLDGDDSGITLVIKDFKDGLILYLNGFTGDPLVSEELMEEVFVKLAVKKPGFKGESSFKTWLYCVARNLALDHLRKCRKREHLPLEECAENASDEDIEREYLRTEQRISLHRALECLKTDYYQVLYLTYFENFNNADTARIMKKSRRQIENLIYRAKLALRKELDKEGFIYEEL